MRLKLLILAVSASMAMSLLYLFRSSVCIKSPVVQLLDSFCVMSRRITIYSTHDMSQIQFTVADLSVNLFLIVGQQLLTLSATKPSI